MSGLLVNSPSYLLLGGHRKLKNQTLCTSILSSSSSSTSRILRRTSSVRLGSTHKCRNGITAFFFNPAEDPIVKEIVKEPVAFMGGVFAGLLRLDLTEDPLKEWVTRTVESAGITEEEIDAEGSNTEEVPTQIEIE